MSSGNLQADPLFLGLTRPAMVLGVSYTYFLLNAVVVLVFFINLDGIDKFIVLFSSVPIHGIGYLICLKEPRAIELVMTKLGKCMRCKNVRYHGFTNSYDAY